MALPGENPAPPTAGARPPRRRAARPPASSPRRRRAVTCPPRVPRRRTAAPRSPREVFSSRKAGSGAAPAAGQGPPRLRGPPGGGCGLFPPLRGRPGAVGAMPSPRLGSILGATGLAPPRGVPTCARRRAGPARGVRPVSPPRSRRGERDPGPGERKTVESFSHGVTAGYGRGLYLRPSC